MGSRRLRVAVATAAVALLAATAAAVVPATGGRHRDTAERPGCAARLLKDWSDGRIDGVYPLACYREALKSLPADLAVYSSAGEDIRRALSRRIVQSAETHRARRSLTR